MSFRLLHQIGDPRWQLHVSTAMLLEYDAAMKREFKRQGRDLAFADDMLDYFARESTHRTIFFRSRPSLADPGAKSFVAISLA